MFREGLFGKSKKAIVFEMVVNGLYRMGSVNCSRDGNRTTERFQLLLHFSSNIAAL